jgi:hypothetical protein
MAGLALRGGLAFAGLVAATTLTAGVGAPRALAEPGCTTSSNDFDRDGAADVAVGLPGASGAAGAVEVLLTNGGTQRVVRLTAPEARGGDRFGAAIAEVSAFRAAGDEDRCSLLAVGAPGRDAAGRSDAGAVLVYRYDASQRQFVLVREFRQGADGVPGTAQAGARFGAAVAAAFHSGAGPDKTTRLYAGAPGTDVAGAADAGGFAGFELDGATAVNGRFVRQGAGAPGAAEAGDAFGSALAVARGDALVGAPGENRGAGGFVHWHANPAVPNLFVTQNTAGVPGTGEPGDHYGAVLYYSRESLDEDEDVNMLLVGAPDEDVGAASNAGSVHRFRFRDTVELDDVRGFNQDTPGVAGAPETGDHFGAALGTVGNFSPLVGVPGEDVGAVRDAGIVSEVQEDRSWSENTSGMPDVAEAGDRFGATIANALIPDPPDAGRGWGDALLIGTPGENAGAGAVVRGVSGAGLAFPVAWSAQNPRPGDGYGTAIGKSD